jgi:bifunctional DNase/RNase
MHQVEVIGVRVEMPSNQPIILLRESEGARYLPIWVGAVEATAIAFAQQGVISPRPLTHDLFASVIRDNAIAIRDIYLTELRDGIFYATINYADGRELSARPSDALALALRLNLSIFATDELFNQAGIEIPDQEEEEVEKFKEFLDHINPEDFAS